MVDPKPVLLSLVHPLSLQHLALSLLICRRSQQVKLSVQYYLPEVQLLAIQCDLKFLHSIILDDLLVIPRYLNRW